MRSALPCPLERRRHLTTRHVSGRATTTPKRNIAARARANDDGEKITQCPNETRKPPIITTEFNDKARLVFSTTAP